MLYDIVVIGGGINGCGCAADAALRGLSVLLCEQDDLAAHTSSQSSKLIHGGLRYLEQYEFRLVQQALEEQEILMSIAPHLIHLLPFILPYRPGLRPAWLLRCGLLLYDYLCLSNRLPNSRTIKRFLSTPSKGLIAKFLCWVRSLGPAVKPREVGSGVKVGGGHRVGSVAGVVDGEDKADYFAPLATDISKGFLFYDAQTDDARLTLSVALQAQANGATILTRTKFIKATVQNGHWAITLKHQDGSTQQISAKAIINAAGPWASQIAQNCQIPIKQTTSYVKGSHIVVPAFYSGNQAYLLQAPDKRVIFVIPYHGHILIGTTEILISDVDSPPAITQEEIQYLSNILQSYFHHKITTITTTWSGIRSLAAYPHQAPSQLSRDFSFECHTQPLPMLTILSGKLTTYRRLGVQVIDSLQAIFPNLPPTTTHRSPLPGSVWHNLSYEQYLQHAQNGYGWLDPAILKHYLQTYGSRMEVMLQNCTQASDLGRAFGPILRQKEVDFLRETEWAQTADDIVWRRTQLGFSLETKDYQALEGYLSE